MFLAMALAASPNSFNGISALSAILAAIIAGGTFYMAARATRTQGNSAKYAVDADAYKRGVEIYEATISTLRTEVADLRTEIKGLHDEVKQLRISNVELAHELDSFRNRGSTHK